MKYVKEDNLFLAPNEENKVYILDIKTNPDSDWLTETDKKKIVEILDKLKKETKEKNLL